MLQEKIPNVDNLRILYIYSKCPNISMKWIFSSVLRENNVKWDTFLSFYSGCYSVPVPVLLLTADMLSGSLKSKPHLLVNRLEPVTFLFDYKFYRRSCLFEIIRFFIINLCDSLCCYIIVPFWDQLAPSKFNHVNSAIFHMCLSQVNIV